MNSGFRYRYLVVTALLFLGSCAEWRKAQEEGEQVQFDIETPDTRKERKRKKEEEPKESVTKDKNSDAILDKYARELGVSRKELKDPKLYAYIDGWIGVPYKFAGNTKDGVDCSGFVNAVFRDVYKISLKRSATEIIGECNEIEKSSLTETDLVFFDISGKNSHIGIYLSNQKFIHASTSKGVMISDLNQTYWQKYWGRAGRIRK